MDVALMEIPCIRPQLSFQEQCEIIELDMVGKIARRDWHGVMDCAADLRELEAKECGRLEALQDMESR